MCIIDSKPNFILSSMLNKNQETQIILVLITNMLTSTSHVYLTKWENQKMKGNDLIFQI